MSNNVSSSNSGTDTSPAEMEKLCRQLDINTRTVEFYLNGKKKVIYNCEPHLSLLKYLRTAEVGLYGCKLGCGEGGCGACTVMVSHYDAEKKMVVNRAVNGCLFPVAAVDGKHVITVEAIGSTKSKLHPIQQIIADSDGSQCGFCTPGIVMSLYTLLRNKQTPTMDDVERCWSGNLCRCTGYRPLYDAARTVLNQCCGGSSSSEGCACRTNQDDEPTDTVSDYVRTDAEPIFPPALRKYVPTALMIQGRFTTWFRPTSLQQLLGLKQHFGKECKLSVGSTELGVEMHARGPYKVLIHPNAIPELNQCSHTESSFFIGACTSLTDVEQWLRSLRQSLPSYKVRSCEALLEQLRWFAGPQIRNVACIAGSICTASPISDVAPVFMAMNASIHVVGVDGTRVVPYEEFVLGYRTTSLKDNEVVVSVEVPFCNASEFVGAYMVTRRREDDMAVCSACFRVQLDDEKQVVKSARLSYGGMDRTTKLAKSAADTLAGLQWNEDMLDKVYAALEQDLPLAPDAPGGMVEFRKTLTTGFFYKFYLMVMKLISPSSFPANLDSAIAPFHREIPSGSQIYNEGGMNIVGKAVKHRAADIQVSGEAQYTHDIPDAPNQLHAVFVHATNAYAKVTAIHTEAALELEGVKAVYTGHDVPGTNTGLGVAFNDEELLATDLVRYFAQPVAVVVATSHDLARAGARLVRVEYDVTDMKPVLTIDDAIAREQFFFAPHQLIRTESKFNDDIDAALRSCDHVVEGEARIGGQEHFYFETNAAYAIPGENREMLVYSSTQNPNVSQREIARVCGIDANRVVVKVKRMGGGFGGKESRTYPFSCACAMAAQLLQAPVRMTVDRDIDMQMTGTRHPFMGRYKIGCDKSGKLVAMDVTLYSNGGYSLDLSQGVMDRALFHIDNGYQCPNTRVRGNICKTNTPSNTAFRGFGAPQAMFICESMMQQLANELKMEPKLFRELNLYSKGDIPQYKQELDDCVLRDCWTAVLKQSKYDELVVSAKEFNQKNRYKKRGVAIIPTKYGMSFTVRFLNQAGALVHCYSDGTVLVSHGGCEMGQGLHTKMCQIAAEEFGIPLDRVYIQETSTDKVANTAPTAASVQSDINGMAVLNACKQITERLQPLREKYPEKTFAQLCQQAYMQRINLSANGFYKTPKVGYDFDTQRGTPFNYHNYGASVSMVELDTLTGDLNVLQSDIVMDVGCSLNPSIDVGQIEGAFIQGMGLFTLEELVTAPNGFLLTRGPGAYKIPCFGDIPVRFSVSLLPDNPNPRAIHSSKGIGEPPLFLAASILFAARDAIGAARQEEGLEPFAPLNAPATCAALRVLCEDRHTNQFIAKKQAANSSSSSE